MKQTHPPRFRQLGDIAGPVIDAAFAARLARIKEQRDLANSRGEELAAEAARQLLDRHIALTTAGQA